MRAEEERKRIEEEKKKKAEEARRLEEARQQEEEKKKRETEEENQRREEERKRKEEERKRREEERRKREEMMALAKTIVSVKCVGDLKNANCYVGVIVIASYCCNDSESSVLNLSRFVNLRELKVGDECFENVKEVKLIGLNQLERVVIGKNSFTKKNGNDYDPDRHFYLKNCWRLRELKMGCFSFADYAVCEIENVPCLEVIEMGKLQEESKNYYYSSLELKSDS